MKLSKSKLYAQIPIEVSARHLHLSADDLHGLFRIKELTVERAISQPGQYAAKETVALRGPRGKLENVRVVGPLRTETQLELAASDCRVLGITPHFAVSGDLASSGGEVLLVGPRGSIALEKGVIAPLPHLHLSPKEAEVLGLAHLDRVTVRLKAEREVSLHGVVVRSRAGIDASALHLDVDQMNAIGREEHTTIISLQKENEK